MYRPASTSTQNISYSGARLSTSSNAFDSARPSNIESESDLSEADDAPNASVSSHPDGDEGGRNTEDQKMTPESSHEEDVVGSDDAEYDIETPPLANRSLTHDERSSSDDSRSVVKRKVGIEQDDFMNNDPELYGLRRSVSFVYTA